MDKKLTIKSKKKQNSNILKIGLIGCGRISLQHLAAINNFKNQIQLVAVSDINKEKARKVGQKYNIPFYINYRNLLKKRDLDLVVICAPNGLHYPIGIATAKAGKHALIEKPLALNLREADDLISMFKTEKRELFVVMQVRYNQALRRLKKVIQDGNLGKIYNATLTIRWTRPQSYFQAVSWRGTKSLDGGALLNQGIHYIDAFQWILGRVKSVYGVVDRVAHNIETEDEAFSLLRFKNGAYGLVEFTICAYPQNLECSITVLGEKGTVKLGGKAINEIEFWKIKDCSKPRIQRKSLSGFSGSSPNHFFIYRDIVNYFQKNKKVFFNGKEVRKSLEIIEAIYKSARQNKEIKLPLK